MNPKMGDLPENHVKITTDKPNFDFAKAKDRSKLKKKGNISVHYRENPW